jgi:hypothetical protein
MRLKKQPQTFLNPTETFQYFLHAIMSAASLMSSKAPFQSQILFIHLLFTCRIIFITSLYPVWEKQSVYLIRVKTHSLLINQEMKLVTMSIFSLYFGLSNRSFLHLCSIYDSYHKVLKKKLQRVL